MQFLSLDDGQVEKSSSHGRCHFGTSVGGTRSLESRSFMAVVVSCAVYKRPTFYTIASTNKTCFCETTSPNAIRKGALRGSWQLGWCVLCLFLRFPQFAHHPPPQKKYHPMRKVFCGDGAWFAVPYLLHNKTNPHLQLSGLDNRFKQSS